MKYFISFLTVSFFCCTSHLICAQQLVVTSGATASNSIGSLSYSIGQIATSSVSNQAGTMIEGLNQPYIIEDVSVPNTVSLDCAVNIFPNPTSNNIRVQPDGCTDELIYTLYNMKGQIIITRSTSSGECTFFMGSLPSGGYMLNIKDSQNRENNYKIIKK